jgi:hypothetical protein
MEKVNISQAKGKRVRFQNKGAIAAFSTANSAEQLATAMAVLESIRRIVITFFKGSITSR